MNAPTNLTEFIVNEVQAQTSEDALRLLVQQKIGATVAESVKRAFETYGPIGKQIDAAVVAALQIGDRVDVPAYGNMVMALLRAKMDEVLQQLVNERLTKEMDDILKLAPKEVKLTDVVAAMIRDIDQQDRYGTYATCIIESGGHLVEDYRHIYLDPESNAKKYDCALQLGVTPKGEIYSLKVDHKDAKTTVVIGHIDAWQKMVFAAYCCGSKFIIDSEEPSTGIGDF